MDERYNQESALEVAVERARKRFEMFGIEPGKAIPLLACIDTSRLKDKTILFDYDYQTGHVVSHVEDVSGTNNLEFLEKIRNKIVGFLKKEEQKHIEWYKEFVRIYLADYFRLPGFCQFHVTYPLMVDVTPEISIEIPFENMVSLGWPTLHVWKSTYEKHHKLGFICDGIVFFCKQIENLNYQILVMMTTENICRFTRKMIF